jgi:transcriptional regulator with XRE-family HTH domain
MDRRVEPVSSLESDHNASHLAQKVGRRIKDVRLERGLSRRDFGAKLGVSGQQIEKYENGKDTVPLHRLLKLASICGISPQTFWSHGDISALGASVIRSAEDISTLQLVRAYRRIADAKVRRRLLQLVKQMAGDEESIGS